MTEKENRVKDKKDRLQQKERVDAETQRSLAVAEMKKAHKLIEDTEKTRKHSALESICLRIDTHSKGLLKMGKMYLEEPFAGSIPKGTVLDIIKNDYQVYESIRYDFQKTMGIGDEEINILFPKIELKTMNFYSASETYALICEQLIDMRHYCHRMLA